MPEDRRDQIEPMQPDPMMREGRSGNGWVWIVSGAILVAIIVTFFAVNANHDTAQNKPNANPPITTGAGSRMPQPAQPTGRNTSNAPPSGNQSTVR
jgi:hypothetical protein